MPPIRLNCPVCNFSLRTPATASGDHIRFDCPHCGEFIFSDTALEDFNSYIKTERQKSALSYAIRRAQISSKRPKFLSEQIAQIAKEEFLPSPKEQADNLIYWLGNNLSDPGKMITVNPRDHGAIVGSSSVEGFVYIVRSSLKEGYLEGRIISWSLPGGPNHAEGAASITLTFKGWEQHRNLRRGAAAGLTAFMAMEFDDSELDELVDKHFRPAVEKTGFILRRLNDNPRAGLIDDRLRVEIRNCRFLVADLTHANHGAYWESGFAEGLGKPVIYTCKKAVFDSPDSRPHFDTNHHLTVLWDSSEPQEAVKQLKATIRATLPEAKQTDD